MLISFSISNFRSFREEQTLSMVASGRLADHPDHCFPLPGTNHQILPLAVFYGANAAGKSNWVKAMAFAINLILRGTKPDEWINNQPFVLSREQLSEPTGVEFRFVVDNLTFSYGFTTSDTEIVTEWLSLIEGEQERNIYERASGVQVKTGPVLDNSEFGDYSNIKDFAKAGVRPNLLFLTAIRQIVDRANRGLLFEKVLEFFEDQLEVISPEAFYKSLTHDLVFNPEFSFFANRYLNEASTGMNRLRVKEHEIKEGSFSPATEEIKREAEKAAPGWMRSVLFRGKEVLISKTQDGKLVYHTIQAEHPGDGGQAVLLPLEEESDGTKRLTNLLPVLFFEKRVFIIDEIDRSLHPSLSKKFVEFFLKSCHRTGSQLIFTTHESNLLDLELLRRDEIWFMEKNPEGATELYSLSDFRVRQDLRIQKGYLQGRFGAIPFLGNLDRLLEETKVA